MVKDKMSWEGDYKRLCRNEKAWWTEKEKVKGNDAKIQFLNNQMSCLCVRFRMEKLFPKAL